MPSTDFEKPRSRNEAILQNMLGADNVLEKPRSREEKLLQDILNSGGSGGGSTPLFVNLIMGTSESDPAFSADKTWNEINDHLNSGGIVYGVQSSTDPETGEIARRVAPLGLIISNPSDPIYTYCVCFGPAGTGATPTDVLLTTTDPDGYPAVVDAPK